MTLQETQAIRRTKTVNGTTTGFVWNGDNLALEETGGNVNAYAYDMTGIHIANRANAVVSYIKDEHGNVVGQKSSTEQRYQYDAFGNPLKKVVGSGYGNIPDGFGYCGEYYDSESGLIYLRNRYYDSETGRFMTEDPIKDGMNWYVYASSNPVQYKDATGLAKDGDERLSQKERDVIEMYSTIWFDAQVAFEKNIITASEKFSVQGYAESKADDIRYAHDHPFLTWGSDVLEFVIFDIALGDFNTVVHAADFTEDGINKMYNNEENFSAIVAAGLAKGFTGGNSRTIGNTEIKGKNVRIDIEMPTGSSSGNLHLHNGDEKIYINSVDDINDLAKGLRKNDKVVKWVKKGIEILNKVK